VDLPEQVVTPGEELWVKIIDLDLQRRRISLSIKQAAEGGTVAAEYQEHFGEHAYDDEGNYIGGESSEGQEAWAELYGEEGEPAEAAAEEAASVEDASVEAASVEAAPVEAASVEAAADEVPAEESLEATEATEATEA